MAVEPDPLKMICLPSGKRKLTRKQAMREALWWRRVRFARMNHYHCHKCKSWHVGNDKP